MDVIFPSFLTAFLVTYFAIPPVIRLASIRNLFDEPDERKQHQTKVAALGGIAIFTGIIFSVLFWVDGIPLDFLRWFTLAGVLIFLIGLQDDIVAIRPLKKLIGELIASGMIIYYGNVRIYSLQGLLGIYELPYILSFLITIFIFILITNAYNLIDGIDGLAAGIGIISSGAFGCFFWYSGQAGWAAVAFAVVGALVAFLKFNFAPAKIFMGDGGSLFIGFLLSIQCVKFLDLPILLSENKDLLLPSPAIALAILVVPLIDTLRVFVQRMINGKSPFHPDRNHIHHVLLDLGLRHQGATLILCSSNLLFIFGTLAFADYGLNTLFLMVILNSYLLINVPKFLLHLNKQEMKKRKVLNI